MSQTLKLYLTPNPDRAGNTNGVGRVVEAQYRYLPDFGIEFVSEPAQADIVAAHVQADNLPNLDVLHLHGLYFTADPPTCFNERAPLPGQDVPEPERWQQETNRQIANAVRRARSVTMPSDWAAEVLRRDMRLSPTIIPNGVSPKVFAGNHANGHYLLWNKNRVDVGGAIDPGAAYDLSRMGVPVLSTFEPTGLNPNEPRSENFKAIGVRAYGDMIAYIKHAEAYLATTREVMSLSVLEAMAAGVPILGYRWGGTAEVVRHKVEGYLAEPGDLDDLLAGWRWLKDPKNREQVSRAARARAMEYAWPAIIEQYASLYKSVLEKKRAEQHRVGVIITSYNYAQYLPQAIESVLTQTRKADKIIVVNDGSTDNTGEVALRYAMQGVQLLDQPNAGVAAARNNGIAATEGACEYIVCLDADDALDPRYIETVLPPLVRDRGQGISWSKLAVCDQDLQPTGNVWHFNYKWEDQASPDENGVIRNGVPCAAIFRREMWERAGGYKQVYHPAEDAEFWLRGTSLGYTAKRATDEPLFLYRTHADSASRSKPTPPIHGWHPFSLDKQYPFAAPSRKQPLVKSYSRPVVSVIIPVGPGHVKYLPGALDSVIGQSFRDFEVVVVDDTETGAEDAALAKLCRTQYPFVKLLKTPGRMGPAVARNLGVGLAAEAGVPLCLFLDSDDYLQPQALKKMVSAFVENGGTKYIYTDWLKFAGQGQPIEPQTTPEYDQLTWLRYGLHAVTVLMPTQWVTDLGGFDTELPAWEDWELFIKAAQRGMCGERLAEPLLAYRIHSGQRREEGDKHARELLALFQKRYEGKDFMACGTCGSAKGALPLAQGALMQMSKIEQSQATGLVELEYVGPAILPISYRGPASGETYHAGQVDKYIRVLPQDVPGLTNLGVFVTV